MSVAATRPARPWLAFLAGGAAGFAILMLTQVLSETRIAFGPWALDGNGALAVPLVGFPLVTYAGWAALSDGRAGRDLASQLAAFSLGLLLGAFPLSLLFALPILIITAAICATWMRGSAVKRQDTLLWIAFAASVAVGTLPVLGLFGVALLPGSVILLARGKPRSVRIALGSLLVLASVFIVFGAPLLFPAPAPST
ncbi:MAG TPA: hypothetical protein VGT60_11670 [Candidatus Limnocylindria bacterium]|nr:hypothetical protein [Candidatus Limnocylindria bacterium]